VTLVAIHQPNFFPWLGFFEKIARSDRFVLMDNVQLPKTGRGSWVNRVRLMVNGSADWATMPLLRHHGELTRIADVVTDDSQPWRLKLVRKLQLNYAKAPHFDDVFPLVETLVLNREPRLVAYNAYAIRLIADLLELRTPIVLGSDVGGDGHASDLLVSMVKRVGGTAYLCGAGALAYQSDEIFAAAGIAVLPQNFQHPVYVQRHQGPFVPGLSVIDVLMNWGVDSTRQFLAGRTRGSEPGIDVDRNDS
jgi:hypothetical protein